MILNDRRDYRGPLRCRALVPCPLLATTGLGDNVAGLCHLVGLTTLFPDGETVSCFILLEFTTVTCIS